MDTQTYNYKVVRQFAIMTVVWGIVGMLVGVIVAAQLLLRPSIYPISDLGSTSAACVLCTPMRLFLHSAVAV